MKNALMTIVLILASIGLIHAQVTTTVFGNVVNFNGQPVPNWPVFQDLFNGTITQTQADGSFILPVTLDTSGSTLITIGTLNCDGSVLLQSTDISLPSVPIIFTVCDSIVNPPPACFVDFGYNQSQNLSVDFYGYAYDPNDSLAVFSYTWNFGDGTTTTGDIVSHTYAAPGTYTVELIATSGGCTSVTQYAVQVFDFGPTQTIVVSGTVLNEDDLSPVPFGWVTVYGTNPGSTNSGLTNPDGSYSLTALVSDTATSVLVESYDMCTFTPVQQLVPITNGTAIANFLVCVDSVIVFPPSCHAYITYNQLDSLTFQFAANDWSGNPIVGYHWDFGDGTTSTDPNPIHTYAQVGIYTVALTGLTSDSCTTYTCEVVCVFGNGGGNPIDTFYYGCQAYFMAYPIGFVPDYKTFQFESLSMGQVVSYNWDFGDGSTSNEPSPVHAYANEGVYNVALTIETLDGCESTIVMAVIAGQDPTVQWDCQAMFLPLPIPDSIGVPLSYVFIDMSLAPGAINSYFWDFGDGSTSTEQNPFHTYAQSGVYTVTLTIQSDSCTSVMNMTLDTDNPMFSVAGGAPIAALGQNTAFSAVDDLTQVFSGITLFPNPTTTQAVVAFESKENTSYTYTILDLNGRTLSTQSARAVIGQNVLPLVTADLTPGLHLLRIQTEQGVETVKFVKE